MVQIILATALERPLVGKVNAYFLLRILALVQLAEVSSIAAYCQFSFCIGWPAIITTLTGGRCDTTGNDCWLS